MKYKPIRETLIEQNKDIKEGIWKELAETSTEYGAGWHNLLIELMEKIEGIYKKNNIEIEDFEV